MSMVQVWNITDDPTTDVAPCTLMVMGRNVAPGRYVRVPEERLKNAHKLNKDVANGLLHIGRKPPEHYATTKKPPRAAFPKGHGRAHGTTPMASVEAPAEEAAKVTTVESVVELKEEVVEESVAEDTSEGYTSSRHGRRSRSSSKE